MTLNSKIITLLFCVTWVRITDKEMEISSRDNVMCNDDTVHLLTANDENNESLGSQFVLKENIGTTYLIQL